MDDTDLAGQVGRAFSRYRFNPPLADVVDRRNRGRLRPRWMAVAATVVVAITLWTLNAAPWNTGPQLVFAGWNAVPTAPDAALAAAAADACRGSDPNAPQLPAIAQDQRGSAATILFAGDGQLSICLLARDDRGTIVAVASGLSRLAPTTAALSVDTGLSAPQTNRSDGITIVAGRVNDGVSSVQVRRADGANVEATVRSGYFVAWWPTTDKPATMIATDAAGHQVAKVDSPQ